MRLIINADDFGLSNGQNYGIIDCFKNGVVTAATILTTGNAFQHACQLANNNPSLDIGVHLSLDIGKPLTEKSKIPSLLGDDNEFNRYNLNTNSINVCPKEVYIEWRNQIEAAYSMGLSPTHIDSHHHIHMMIDIFPIYLQLAKEFQLAIRFHPRTWTQAQIEYTLPFMKGLKYADYFLNSFYGKTIFPDFFSSVSFKQNHSYEMMCHPAYLDQWILNNSSYIYERAVEVDTLQSSKTKKVLNERNIDLITFREL